MHITHCPQCQTAFKVTPAQLELAKGWVRCGRCSHVFEAGLHFESPAIEATEQPAQVQTSPVVDFSKVRAAPPAADVPTTPLPLVALALTALLAVTFVWQALIWHRDWLVAEEPMLKPVLTQLCAPLGCEVNWPSEPNAVLIESSSFSENPAGGYTVQLRLKNAQYHAVGTPSLELTLTDLQDQVLVRRVFSAQELALPDHLKALRDVRVSIQFDLNDSLTQRVSGFRALVFYP